MIHRKSTRRYLSTLMVIFSIGATCPVNAQKAFADPSVRQPLIEQTRFIQIPGPNPILTPGPEGAWDDRITETADAFEDLGAYYLYYHATSRERNHYELGVASATRPLGPFTKHGDKPILQVGPADSWDSEHVACAYVMKADNDLYYMWYSGCSEESDWSIGLATAPHPLGPWEKHAGNPVLKDFGYLGGVIKAEGKYRIYSAHPINMPWAAEAYQGRSPGYHSDYSPLAVAIGNRPEGPFTKYAGNPLMEKGNPGDWDDGGISEAEVLYHNGMYHMFYGATSPVGPRLESIGYAYSFDGLNWIKYGANPVAVRHANPNAAAFAEVHAIIEPPFIYLYHTLRPEHREVRRKFSWVEDLGVQVLITQRPFSLHMPALVVERLAPGQSTTLKEAPPIALSNVKRLSLTAECTYGAKAKKPIRVLVRGSYDGVIYDTVDLHTLNHELQAGQTVRKTFVLASTVRFIKVMVENPDKRESVSKVIITATLGD